MSELKAFDVGLSRYYKDGSPCVVAFAAGRSPRVLNKKVYLKFEADKVIAELEENHKTEVKELLCLIRDKEKISRQFFWQNFFDFSILFSLRNKLLLTIFTFISDCQFCRRMFFKLSGVI